TQTRQAVRTRCVPIQTTEQRTVCVNQGYWANQSHCGYRGCGGCGSCYGGGCRVWVNQMVQKVIDVNVWRYQQVQEPYQYNVTVCRPETRTRTVNVVDYQTVAQPYEYQVTTCRPETRTRTVNVVNYQQVQQPYEYHVTVCRPETRTQTVNVTEYKLEEQPY